MKVIVNPEGKTKLTAGLTSQVSYESPVVKMFLNELFSIKQSKGEKIVEIEFTNNGIRALIAQGETY